MASLPCGGETWRPFICGGRCRTPDATHPDDWAGNGLRVSPRVVPIRSCSRRGLPCRFRCRSRGGLLPHPFTLAPPADRLFHQANRSRSAGGAVCFLWHFPWGLPPPAVCRRRVSVEPGLSSNAAFRLSHPRPPGRLAQRIKGLAFKNASPAMRKGEKAGSQTGANLHCRPLWPEYQAPRWRLTLEQ